MTTTEPVFEIVRAESLELIEQCKAVRFEVFVDEQKFSFECEIDSHDTEETTIHLLLRITPSLKPIGTLRLYPASPPTPVQNENGDSELVFKYKLGRVCILEPFRKFKLGARLMSTAHDVLGQELRAKHPSDGPIRIEIVLHAQLIAMGFYARSGYEGVGPDFDEDGQQHRAMRAVLAA